MTSVHRPLCVFISALFILTLLVAGSVRGAPAESIIYVKHDATGSNNGSSWTDAYTDLQDALGVAQASDEIWVTEGVYYPAPNALHRTATFELQDGVGLYGGFAGTETGRDQRDWEANVTVLSGDLDRNDTTDENGVVTDTVGIVGRNAYHVVSGDGVGETTVLDSFTITAGLADGAHGQYYGGGMRNIDGSKLTLSSVTFSGNQAGCGGGMYNHYSNSTLTNVNFTSNTAESYGGGMYNRSSSPTLTNVTFSDNRAQTRFGGGLFNSAEFSGGGGSPTLTNVEFTGNRAVLGGGMYTSGSFYTAHPRLSNVVFSNNSASSDGGGMYNYECNVTLTNVTFHANRASHGGGICRLSEDSTLTNVTFSDNEASRYGGGLYGFHATLTWVTFDGNRARETGGGMQGSGTLTNVTFTGNQAELGGGMSGSGTLTNVTFTGNQAELGGGMSGSGTLTNVTFTGNQADSGGGMRNSSDSTLSNCTFSANQAKLTGAGLYNENSSPVLVNCILWGNSAPTGPQFHNEGTSAPYVMYSNVEGGYPGEGNIDADPLFVDPVAASLAPTNAGDYRLTEGSPLIDAGTNDMVTVDTDLDGNPRIVDGNGDGNAVVDMGAYEFQIPPSTLTITKQGQGRVASTPSGIDCGTNCTGEFLPGTPVTLTASADPGWTFADWSGDVDSTDNPLALTVQGETVITATFTQEDYTLDVSVVGQGTVTKEPEQDAYHYGDVVTLTAAADLDWTFIGWSGDVDSRDNPLELVLKDDTVIVALFNKRVYLPLVLKN